jgi:hypothetical protein
MSPAETNKFFVCKTCQKEQNLDQSLHVKQAYCVSCFNKEQIHGDMMEDMQNFIDHLKLNNQYTKARKKKINDLIKLNEILLPSTIITMDDEDILSTLKEAQQLAFKMAIQSNLMKYKYEIVDTYKIDNDFLKNIEPIWQYKRSIPKDHIKDLKIVLEPVIKLPTMSEKKINELFSDLKKQSKIPYFTQIKGNYIFKYLSPFKLKDGYLLKTVKTYRKKIIKANNHIEKFQRFIQVIGNKCQFQTMDDKLMKALQGYMQEYRKEELDIFTKRILKEINGLESTFLIPNMAKYILDNYERIFYRWYCNLMCFNRNKFMVDNARTGSRTDFVIQLFYNYDNSELKVISRVLEDTTELMLKDKGKIKISKLKKNKALTPEDRQKKIAKVEERLIKSLEPAALAQKQIDQKKTAPMVARVLVLNAEKAFNIVLDKVIRYHYKRLGLTTPVQYITNVLSSKFHQTKNNLEVSYLIQSREW